MFLYICISCCSYRNRHCPQAGGACFFLWDVHQIDTLSRIMLNYQSKDSRANKASRIPDLISNEVSTVISAMIYAPDTIRPTG